MNDPNHPAAGNIIAALEAETMRAERIECAEAGMPASDHPVVQRTARILDAARTRSAVTAAHLAIMTALEHMTADDLRNIPVVQELMAEAWEEGTLGQVKRVYIGDMSQKTLSIIRERIAPANPYRQPASRPAAPVNFEEIA